jgi:hypothetical protein
MPNAGEQDKLLSSYCVQISIAKTTSKDAKSLISNECLLPPGRDSWRIRSVPNCEEATTGPEYEAQPGGIAQR